MTLYKQQKQKQKQNKNYKYKKLNKALLFIFVYKRVLLNMGASSSIEKLHNRNIHINFSRQMKEIILKDFLKEELSKYNFKISETKYVKFMKKSDNTDLSYFDDSDLDSIELAFVILSNKTSIDFFQLREIDLLLEKQKRIVFLSVDDKLTVKESWVKKFCKTSDFVMYACKEEFKNILELLETKYFDKIQEKNTH